MSLLGLLLTLCVGARADTDAPPPHSTLAGNWEVTFQSATGDMLDTALINLVAPVEDFCDPLSHGRCHYRLRPAAGGEWAANYHAKESRFVRDIEVFESMMNIAHGYGLIDQWGVDSTLRFSRHAATGSWASRTENGRETWRRLSPQIDEIRFYAVDAPRGSAPYSTAAPGEVGSVRGTHDVYWDASNTIPGTRPHFVIELLGGNLWGKHWAEVLQGVDLQPTGCVQIVDGATGGNTIGQRCGFNVWSGVEEGRATIRVAGVDVSFDFIIDGDRPDLDPLDLALRGARLDPSDPVHAFIPGASRRSLGSRSFLFRASNEGEVVAEHLEFSLTSEQDHDARLSLCSERTRTCTPCDDAPGRANGRDSRYLCENANLYPEDFVSVLVDLGYRKDPKAQADTPTGDGECPEPENLTLSLRDADREEGYTGNNFARFDAPGERAVTEALRLEGLEIHYRIFGDPFALETLYAGGVFRVVVDLKSKVCDPAALRGMTLLMTESRTVHSRKQTHRVEFSLADNGQQLISWPLQAREEPGWTYEFVIGDERAEIVAAPLPPGNLTVNPVPPPAETPREVRFGGMAEVQYTALDADLRNVLSVTVPIALALELDAAAAKKPVDPESSVDDLAETWPDLITDRIVLENTGDNALHARVKVMDRTARRKGRDPFESGPGWFLARDDRFATAFAGGDLLRIHDRPPFVIEGMRFINESETANAVPLGKEVVVELRLKNERKDIATISAEVEIADEFIEDNTPGEAQAMLLHKIPGDPHVYWGTVIAANHATTSGETPLRGVPGDRIVARVDDATATARLVSRAENPRLLTIHASDPFGPVAAAHGLLEKRNQDHRLYFKANRPVDISVLPEGFYSLTMTFPGCCTFTRSVELQSALPVEIHLPPLVHARATADFLTDEQLWASEFVAWFDEATSNQRLDLVEIGGSWKMATDTGRFQRGNVLAGLALPPGTFEFTLFSGPVASRLRDPATLRDGVTTLDFSLDATRFLDHREVETTRTIFDEIPAMGPLDDTRDYDDDGIPDDVDPDPRRFSNTAYLPGAIPIRIIDRGGNDVRLVGYGLSGVSVEVSGGEGDPPATIEYIGVELILDAGTILELSFG